MKKIILSCLFALLTIVPITAANTSAAVDILPGCNGGQTTQLPASSTACADTKNTTRKSTNPIIGLIKTAIVIVSYITGIAAIVLIIISGINFITASGDPGKVASARSTLLYAIIGVLITVLGQSIVVFVLDKIS